MFVNYGQSWYQEFRFTSRRPDHHRVHSIVCELLVLLHGTADEAVEAAEALAGEVTAFATIVQLLDAAGGAGGGVEVKVDWTFLADLSKRMQGHVDTCVWEILLPELWDLQRQRAYRLGPETV